MDDEVKVNFLRPMLVLKTRDNYKAPYHKNKYLTIKKKNVVNQTVLKKYLKDFVKFWSNGTYDIQYLYSEGQGYMGNAIYATFFRFDVRDGKITKVWKTNPYSKKEYPIWQYFKKGRKKPVRKKKKTKKRKLIKRKIKKKAKRTKKRTSKRKTRKKKRK